MKVLGDAMAFLHIMGHPPEIPSNIGINLAHVTCASPLMGTTAAILAETFLLKNMLLTAKRTATWVSSKSEFDETLERGMLAVILGIQNLPKDADLMALQRADIRIISLVCDTLSPYGSGCLNIDIGLTPLGRQAIRRMGELGLILDLSHASHRTAREALELIKTEKLPISVMASHTGCYGVYPHFYNLPDDVLRGIAEKGGVVGISTVGYALGGVKNSEPMAQAIHDCEAFKAHVRHAINICGYEAVVIGSDGPYTKIDPKQARADTESIRELFDPYGTWGTRYPAHPPHLTGPDKMSEIERLIRSTAHEDAIEAIMGENLLRFFKESLPTGC